ncbi:pectate lyase-like adhesive domain-containing protein [Cytobacillus sp. FSL K6-0265]|uniref:pectate lyase-like adhesive domain-containing protein n=1 Tax=Cytobacillus sp. FSL K6-0265 TaxID=2921448 RepID=UPI0030F634C8
MRKRRLTGKARRKKNYIRAGLSIFIIAILITSMNIQNFFTIHSVNASNGLLLEVEEKKIELHETFKITVSTTIEETNSKAVVIQLHIPGGLKYALDQTKQSLENITNPPKIEYDSSTNLINITYDNSQMGNQLLDLYLLAEDVGQFPIVASKDGQTTHIVNINVEESQISEEEYEKSNQESGTDNDTVEESQISEEEYEKSNQESGTDNDTVEESQGVTVDKDVGSKPNTENEGDYAKENFRIENNKEADYDHFNSVSNLDVIDLVANEIDVNTWNEFVNAVRNPEINKINIMENLDASTETSANRTRLSTYQVRRDLEINGNGNKVNFDYSSIYLGNPTSGEGNFHMHDITLAQRYAGAYAEDIVGSRLVGSYTGKWKYKFGNIIAEPTVQRLARAQYAEVTVYGEMNINTRAENFYLGSFIMEEGTTYKGNVNYYNFSIMWFNLAAREGDTGASREFTIGQNCAVQLTQSQTSGTTYPAIYHHYDSITVGEDSKLDINMPGYAVAFSRDNSIFTVKSGAYVNLTSKSNGSVINFRSIVNTPDNSKFIVEENAELYVIGNSSTGLINMDEGSGHSFILNEPASYDIRNAGTGTNSTAVRMGDDTTFQISDSDIDLWKKKSELLGPSDFNYVKVSDFLIEATRYNNMTVTSTNETIMVDFSSTQDFRRISGLNSLPDIIYEKVHTDADYTLQARVKIGEVPDGKGLDENGNVNYIPVYASEKQAYVDLTDTFGDTHKLYTNREGYVEYTDTKFNLAGEKISAMATRGPWIQGQPKTTEVMDVTPPNPANVDLEVIDEKTNKIIGTADEIGSTVIVEIDGEPIKDTQGNLITARVNEKGNWSFEIPDNLLPLQVGSNLQIILNDNSGLLDVEGLINPPTNNPMGNQNPNTSISYKDAIFKAGPIFKIVEYSGSLSLVAPNIISFGSQLEISPNDQLFEVVTLNEKLGVIDTRKEKSSWKLSSSLVEPLYNQERDSTLPIVYIKDGVVTELNNFSTTIFEHLNTDDEPFYISDLWNGKFENGLYVQAQSGEARIGKYEAVIKWTLEDTPSNQ